MRMRRKPWARPELEACPFFINSPIEYRNKWSESFNKKQPIHLELGCGKGGFISNLASKNQDINYIAIDIKSEVLGLAKRNVETEYEKLNISPNNILLTAWEIGMIEKIIGEEDKFDRIYINFCNPWPKPRHNKRRLTYITYLEKYKTFLNENAEIYFKTDEDDLFKDSIEYFKQAGYKLEKITYDLHSENCKENIETEHEKMFSEQGIKIKALIAKV